MTLQVCYAPSVLSMLRRLARVTGRCLRVTAPRLRVTGRQIMMVFYRDVLLMLTDERTYITNYHVLV